MSIEQSVKLIGEQAKEYLKPVFEIKEPAPDADKTLFGYVKANVDIKKTNEICAFMRDADTCLEELGIKVGKNSLREQYRETGYMDLTNLGEKEIQQYFDDIKDDLKIYGITDIKQQFFILNAFRQATEQNQHVPVIHTLSSMVNTSILDTAKQKFALNAASAHTSATLQKEEEKESNKKENVAEYRFENQGDILNLICKIPLQYISKDIDASSISCGSVEFKAAFDLNEKNVAVNKVEFVLAEEKIIKDNYNNVKTTVQRNGSTGGDGQHLAKGVGHRLITGADNVYKEIEKDFKNFFKNSNKERVPNNFPNFFDEQQQIQGNASEASQTSGSYSERVPKGIFNIIFGSFLNFFKNLFCLGEIPVDMKGNHQVRQVRPKYNPDLGQKPSTADSNLYTKLGMQIKQELNNTSVNTIDQKKKNKSNNLSNKERKNDNLVSDNESVIDYECQENAANRAF